MKWEEQYAEFKAMVAEQDDLLRNKGREYAGKDDALGNFKAANKLGVSPMQKLGIFLDKHVSSIYSYIANDGKTFSTETIESRIADASNYLFLLRCLIREKQSQDAANADESTKTN